MAPQVGVRQVASSSGAARPPRPPPRDVASLDLAPEGNCNSGPVSAQSVAIKLSPNQRPAKSRQPRATKSTSFNELAALGSSDSEPRNKSPGRVSAADTTTGRQATADSSSKSSSVFVFGLDWPSDEASFGADHRPDLAGIEHRVYSLREYSQLSEPARLVAASVAAAASAPPLPPPASKGLVSSTAGRLLKSMSLDRKTRSVSVVEARVVERRAPKSATAADNDLSSSFPLIKLNTRPLPTGNPITASRLLSEPSTSVTSLLPHSAAGGKCTTPLSESRIKRVRKLFISPLASRGAKIHANNLSPGLPVAGASRCSLGPNTGARPTATVYPTHLYHERKSRCHNHHHLHHYRHHHNLHGHHQARGASQGVYGCPLALANKMYPITCFGRAEIYKQGSIPYVLARLCNHIEENSGNLTHEGIFRVSGNARLMDKLRLLFDRLGDAPLESESVDVATSASMLKLYLRELPEPLIPTRMTYRFIALARKYSATVLMGENHFESPASGAGSRAKNKTSGRLVATAKSAKSRENLLARQRATYLRATAKLLRKLPIDNYNLLKYLACFLYRIAQRQEHNRMCSGALGIVFGPSVFRIRSESYKGLREQELANLVIASVIGNYRSLFDWQLMDALGNLISNDDVESSQMNVAGRGDRPPEVASPTVKASDASQDRRRVAREPVDEPAGRGRRESPAPLQAPNQSKVCDSQEANGDSHANEEDPDDDSLSPLTSVSSYCSTASDSASYGSSPDGEGLRKADDERASSASRPSSSLSRSFCSSDSDCTPTDSGSSECDVSSSDASSPVVVQREAADAESSATKPPDRTTPALVGPELS